MPIRLYGTNLRCARFLVSLVVPFLDRQNELLDADLGPCQSPRSRGAGNNRQLTEINAGFCMKSDDFTLFGDLELGPHACRIVTGYIAN